MIKNIYFTRIENGDKSYGFGITEENEQVYIPGYVVEAFDLTSDDTGTKNKVALVEDKTGKTAFAVTAVLIEDSAMQQAYEWQIDEIKRLEGLLKANGIGF